MAAVADSSSLNYLILIDASHILPELFDRVLIPEAVAQELQSLGTPPEVVEWMSQSPSWLGFSSLASPLEGEGLDSLGAGEREAIGLALELGPDTYLLIDEARGRREANRRQVRYIGTLGVIDRAAARGFVDLPSVLERLLQTSFYVTPDLLKTLLENDARRKQSDPEQR